MTGNRIFLWESITVDCAIYRLPLRSICKGKGKGGGKGERRTRKGERRKGKGKGEGERRKEEGKRGKEKRKGKRERLRGKGDFFSLLCAFLPKVNGAIYSTVHS